MKCMTTVVNWMWTAWLSTRKTGSHTPGLHEHFLISVRMNWISL